MKVSQLARLLDSVILGFDGVLNAGVVNDVNGFCHALQPFGNASVGEFTTFLSRFGAEFQQTGKITAQGKVSLNNASAAKQNGPEPISTAVTAIRGLFDEIDRGSVDEMRIDQVLRPFEKLTIPQLHGILAGLDIAEKPRKKAKIFEKIRQVVGHQMESRARAGSVGGLPARFEPVGAAS